MTHRQAGTQRVGGHRGVHRQGGQFPGRAALDEDHGHGERTDPAQQLHPGVAGGGGGQEQRLDAALQQRVDLPTVLRRVVPAGGPHDRSPLGGGHRRHAPRPPEPMLGRRAHPRRPRHLTLWRSARDVDARPPGHPPVRPSVRGRPPPAQPPAATPPTGAERPRCGGRCRRVRSLRSVTRHPSGDKNRRPAPAPPRRCGAGVRGPRRDRSAGASRSGSRRRWRGAGRHGVPLSGASPKSGIASRAPPCWAEACAITPGRVYRAATQAFTGGSVRVLTAVTKSSTR